MTSEIPVGLAWLRAEAIVLRDWFKEASYEVGVARDEGPRPGVAEAAVRSEARACPFVSRLASTLVEGRVVEF
jgi:hypothetical protein